ncbi:cathepsin B-like protease 3 isoform X2 [Apium graveolens]|uniref:cathepsin B-like protease 3 isoform X2 n=1 Tax=Apium graveolens TaxID=4045 RepID=UPI003D791231
MFVVLKINYEKRDIDSFKAIDVKAFPKDDPTKPCKLTAFFGYKFSQFKHLLGVKPTPLEKLQGIPVKIHSERLNLPSHFDSMTTWPKCSTIGSILDQGHCGENSTMWTIPQCDV